MNMQLEPITVSPSPCTVPRWMVTHSRMMLLSPMRVKVFSPLKALCCGSPPTTACGWTWLLQPISVLAWITQWDSR
jgi:hypothetical protein